jgi:hypothetical protein
MMAVGVLTFADMKLRTAVVAVVAAAGLASSVPNVNTQRTQAPAVAAVINAEAHPGDVVAVCPDQLGPALERLLPDGRYQTIAFPRGTSPAFVNWVDYLNVARHTSPVAFARRVQQMAAPGHHIWLATATGYTGFVTSCSTIATTIVNTPGWFAHQWVFQRPAIYYEPMGLLEFARGT